MSPKLLCGCENMCQGHRGVLLKPRIMRDISYEEYRALDNLVDACHKLQEVLIVPWVGGKVTVFESGILEALTVVDTVREDEAKRSKCD